FTASSNGFGRRILIWSSFFSNSNRVGLNCEKLRLDRSLARNASACLSVLSRGIFFFIGCNLLSVHIVAVGWYPSFQPVSKLTRFETPDTSKRGLNAAERFGRFRSTTF